MTDSNKTYSFPTFLLPSLHLPFRRRSLISPPSSSLGSSPPSLSSSPTSIHSSHYSSPSTPPPRTFTSLNAVASLPTSLSTSTEASPSRGVGTHLTSCNPDILVCLHCSTHLAFASQITSKGFTGRHGRAYLVSPPPKSKSKSGLKPEGTSADLVNIRVGRNANRQLVTGQHVVADISCRTCGTIVGWKYVDAKEVGQKYKIGRFILEVMRVGRVGGWGDEDGYERENSMGEQRVGEWEGNQDEEGEIMFDSDDEDECEDLFAGTWDEDVVRKRRGRRGWMRGGRG